MSLYQTSVLRKHLASQPQADVKAAYAKYSAYFLNKEIQDNIRNSKEEQFQQKFLMELLVNVFGYTMKPDANYNLTTELKNIKDAKKTDGAILKADGAALAVIELKGTETKDLDKVNDQAFKYKNNHRDCVYVITSNFEKLRFFIHSVLDPLEFNLFTLTEERFALLWLFLQKDNLLGGIPVKIKEESLLQEEEITKELYADYSAFKNDLWNDMVQKNQQHNPLLLYKKSQKLLDRFLFIFFSEDKGLLPPNSISVIIAQWTKLKELDEYKPLYSRFQKYFGYMNDGYKGAKYEIHAYNGGLFKTDELLDGLLIDDALLEKHCLKLTNYDFEDEVDTNILGHIFEHSLNDIENVRSKLAGEEVDKSKTKRKKDGVFYTPKYITKYIVDNTVGKLCEEKKTEIGIEDEEFTKDRKGRRKDTIKKLDAQLKQYREWLLQLTICDPACGSGAFLNQALEFLMAEHGYLDELEAQLFEGSIVFPDVESHILENNIYGVDINEESVEIARLSLWLRTAKKGRKLTSLSSNIKCGNSLIDDPKIAGDLAFNWQKQFPKVFAKGGFDVVIGNPPYTYRNAILEVEKGYYKTCYQSTEGNHDLYKYFIEQSGNLTRANGLASFIVPNTFLSANSYKKLRIHILNTFEIEELFDLGLEIFENVVVESVIFLFRKALRPLNQECSVKIQRDRSRSFDSLEQFYTINLGTYGGAGKTFNINISDKFSNVIDRIKTNSIPLGSICYCTVGINTGYIKSDLCAHSKLDKRYHKMLNGKDIGRNFVDWHGEYIMYDPQFVKDQGDRGRSLPPEYIFTTEKILVQRTRRGMKRKLVCYYDDEQYFNLNRLSNIVLTDKKHSLRAIYAILNSALMDFYFNIYFNEYEVKPIHLAKLPINKTVLDAEKLNELATSILDTYRELQVIVNQFLRLLQSKFDLEKPSKKLKHWPSLDFKGFLAELKKAKVPKISLEDADEWMGFFHKKKAEANTLQSEIDRIDKEIDQMVYQLYGLTDEEIAIVENN